MIGKEDFIFRPVMRGILRAESLVDGTVSLGYIALLNEVISIENENVIRARKAEAKR